MSLTVTLAPFVLKKLSNSDFLFCVAKIFKYFDIHKCILIIQNISPIIVIEVVVDIGVLFVTAVVAVVFVSVLVVLDVVFIVDVVVLVAKVVMVFVVLVSL